MSMSDNKNGSHDTGFDMWRDYTVRYGVITAYCICKRYLKMQEGTEDVSEREFCRQLQDAMKSEQTMIDVDVYRRSQGFAELDGDMYSYDKSHRANHLCAGDIDAAIDACSYGDGSVDYKDALTALIARYGMERLRFVLSCEVNWDSIFGNYPTEIYQWARETNIHESYSRFGVRTRPEYLTGLIAEFRQEEQNKGGPKLRNKNDFYIAFYEQLALKGFQAYKASYDYENKHIADICVNGNNIAHLTKTDTIEPNPHAEVDAATIDTLREILKNTMVMCGLVDVRHYFTETDLSVIHANLVKVRMMPDNDLDSNEIANIDTLIEKIEDIAPELGGLAADFDCTAEHDTEQGVEQ